MFSETIVLKGHIIDSLTLAKVLDQTLMLGGTFTILEMEVGKKPSELSRALLSIEAESQATLRKIIRKLTIQGAELLEPDDAKLEKAPKNGVFPEDFHSTTNLETWVRHKNRWHKVEGQQEMDVGIRFDPKRNKFLTVPMADVKRNDLCVVGHEGVRVTPLLREQNSRGFRFMSSDVSTEKPKAHLIHESARQIREARKKGQDIFFVLGPAVIHSGGAEAVVKLIEGGWLQLLFAGNAIATHDIEASFFGTSLGVPLKCGGYAEHGNEHHLRAINRIRMAGSIKAAVESGELKSGIMYSCIKHDIPFVLAGSIRDDGPLPDVITDCMKVQKLLRKKIRNVGITVVVGTVLHGIAVGNLLPASVPMICADINPSSLTKFTDRGSFQSIGIVMDAASFLNELAAALENP